MNEFRNIGPIWLHALIVIAGCYQLGCWLGYLSAEVEYWVGKKLRAWRRRK